jgi:hypothetical protein
MLGDRRGRLPWRRSVKKSVNGNAQRRQRERSGSVARRKRMRLVKRPVKKRRSDGVRSESSSRKKTKSVDERSGSASRKRKRKSAHGSRKRERNMKRLERLVSRRSAKRTASGRSVWRLNSARVVQDAAAVVAHAAGVEIVIEDEIETENAIVIVTETGAEAGAALGQKSAPSQ